MSLNNAYFQCWEHGNVYVLRDVTLSSEMDHTQLESLIEGVDPPDGDEKVACPLCGGEWRIFFSD